MDWNTLPLWARIVVCYLACCALLTACFGMEWLALWWERWTKHDTFDVGEYSALEEAKWRDKRD